MFSQYHTSRDVTFIIYYFTDLFTLWCDYPANSNTRDTDSCYDIVHNVTYHFFKIYERFCQY